MKTVLFALAILATIAFSAEAEISPIGDRDILRIATSTYDKSKLFGTTRVLGLHNRHRVIAEYKCSDICPDYTVRLIRYDVASADCTKVGGVLKSVRIPVSRASTMAEYCFPQVISDNWERYIK